MTTLFVVDGEEKAVEYLIDGIDISADFIGNTYHGMERDEDGRYIATQEDYDWWIDVIANYQALDDLIIRYKEDNDPDEVQVIIEDWAGGDYEVEPARITMGLEQAFGKLD